MGEGALRESLRIARRLDDCVWVTDAVSIIEHVRHDIANPLLERERVEVLRHEE